MSCRVIAQLSQALDRALLDECCKELGYPLTTWQENYFIGGKKLTGVGIKIPTIYKTVIATTNKVAVDPVSGSVVESDLTDERAEELRREGKLVREGVRFNYDLFDYTGVNAGRDSSDAPVMALRDLYEARQRARVAAKTQTSVERICSLAQQRNQRVQIVSQSEDGSAVHLQLHC